MKPFISSQSLAYALLALFLTSVGFAAQPLVELRKCKLVPTEWADGDSFEIKTEDGSQHTVRLYGAMPLRIGPLHFVS